MQHCASLFVHSDHEAGGQDADDRATGE
jgi:hypothetical protein